MNEPDPFDTMPPVDGPFPPNKFHHAANAYVNSCDLRDAVRVLFAEENRFTTDHLGKLRRNRGFWMAVVSVCRQRRMACLSLATQNAGDAGWIRAANAAFDLENIVQGWINEMDKRSGSEQADKAGEQEVLKWD